MACPPSNLYRFQKLVRRNKLAFAAASAVAASLVIGLGIATWSFFREKEARQIAVAAQEVQVRLRQEADADRKKAQTEAAKSQQVSALLQAMLRGVDPDEAAGQGTTLLRNILDRTAAQVEATLKDQPEVEAELLHILGFVYDRIGEIPKAEAAFREAVAIQKHL